jgi:O-antigen ligase
MTSPPVTSAAAPAPLPASARSRLERGLEAVAALGVLAHALFLPISVAGMQIALAFVAGALLALRLLGRRVWARSPLDLPCLVLAAAAVGSLGLGALAGSPPVGWHEATLWRSFLAAPLLLSGIQAWAGAGRVEHSPLAPPSVERAGEHTSLAPRSGERGRSLALAALCVWAAASLLPSAIAWAQYFTGFDPLHALHLRSHPVRAVVPVFPGRFAAVGFFRWYQRLAHDLLPPLCLAGAVALHGGVRPRLRALLGAASLAAAAAVVLTLSRAAWVTLALAGAIVAVGGSRRLRRIALPLVAVGCLAMGLNAGVRTRLAHLASPDATGDRQTIWRVCRAVVADHPLTGVGWGNFPRRSLPYWERLAPDYPLRAWCHDSFFSAWAEGGPLLFGALLAFWALLFVAFLRWRRRSDGLGRAASIGALAALAGMFANSLAHDILYSSEAMFALGFALAVGVALARLPGRSEFPDTV